jgi:Mg-chelatase subunit ChlD
MKLDRPWATAAVALGLALSACQPNKLKPVTKAPAEASDGKDAGNRPDLGLGPRGDAGDLEVAPADNACVAETHAAMRSPADILLLVEASLSMTKPFAGTMSKTQAAKTALFDFVDDPKTAGLSVALQYFPFGYVDKPCLEYDDCGLDKELITSDGKHIATCFRHRVCELAGQPPGSYSSCPGGMGGGLCLCGLSNDMCKTLMPAGQHCETPGECTISHKMCPRAGLPCPNGEGDCAPVLGKCLITGDACNPSFYERLRVPFTDLPGGAKTLLTALDLTDVQAGWSTPLVSGIRGSLVALKKRAAEKPGRPAALVLITAGEPPHEKHVCQPADPLEARPELEMAAKGTPAIPTFVIGVLNDAKAPAAGVVNQLAAAGGTGNAFVLDGTMDVSKQLHDALAKIRNATQSCDFALPMPKMGQIDVGKVNVIVKTGAGKTDLAYVAKPEKCTDGKGGWYYDKDPSSGGQPGRLVLCPSSCAAMRNDPAGSVDVAFGCTSRLE